MPWRPPFARPRAATARAALTAGLGVFMLLAAVLLLPLACTRAAPMPHSAVTLFRLRLDSVGRVRCTAAVARHGAQRVGSAGGVAGLGRIQPREKVEGHAHGARQAIRFGWGGQQFFLKTIAKSMGSAEGAWQSARAHAELQADYVC